MSDTVAPSTTPASVPQRLLGAAIDFGTGLTLLVLGDRAHGALADVFFVGAAVFALVNFIVVPARSGRTLGKSIVGTKMIRADSGAPPGIWPALGRVGVQSVNFGYAWHPFSFASKVFVIVGPIPLFVYGAILVDPLRRGLHDRAAGTLVVNARGDELVRRRKLPITRTGGD